MRHLIPLALVPALFLTACEQVDDLKDTFEGLTNTMVVEGVLLGVEPPSTGSGLDLSGSDFAQGTSIKAYLADASDPTNLGDAPVKGAVVNFVSDGNGGQLPLVDNDDGSYKANAEDDGLVYVSEQVAITADYDESVRSIGVNAPPIANVDISETHPAATPMVVNISDQSFDGLLVVVLANAGSEVAFSNVPDSIDELYDFTHGGGELVVEIDGGAFNEPGLYAVGVAGTRNAGGDDMEDVNTALSTFVAGKFIFYAVTVE